MNGNSTNVDRKGNEKGLVLMVGAGASSFNIENKKTIVENGKVKRFPKENELVVTINLIGKGYNKELSGKNRNIVKQKERGKV